MNECFGKKYILNGTLHPAEHFDNTLVYDGDSVYEVIRMVKGSPVFFYDHLERLTESTRLQKKKMLVDESRLKRDIINLTKSDKRKELNLKVVFNYNKGKENYLAYFIEPIYPTDKQYKEGVRGILYYAERKNPVSKVINHKLRSSIFHKLILEGAYEALLVNEEGRITEGSRTNIFFMKGDTLETAPDGLILNGITRKHILDLCIENKIKVKFDCVSADRISDYDAVFMTGTSPVVLPFCCIDNYSYAVTYPLIGKLRDLYLKKAEESITNFRNGMLK